MGTGEMLRCDRLAPHPGGSRNTPSRFMLVKPETSAGLMARKQKMFMSERDQDHDTKKEQALSITFSQCDWFISQNERF